MAVDINTTANRIYQHNFPSTKLLSFGLEKLTLHQLEALNVNMLVMSPPCQPFTRVGKKGDCEDVRTKSFLHILKLLREITSKPTYILVENVKGFETSQARQMMIECLEDCGYKYQEFLLTPLQFGIPNCRLRYYLVAKMNGLFSFEVQREIMTVLPRIMTQSVTDKCLCGKDMRGHTAVKSQVSMEKKSADLQQETHIHNTNSCHDCSAAPASVCNGLLSNQKSCSSQLETAGTTQNTDSGSLGDGGLSNYECHSSHLAAGRTQTTQSASLYVGKPSNHECCTSLQETSRTTQNSGSDSTKMKADIDTEVSELAALKDAGRNMRYCEEDDGFITESSRPLSDFMECGSFEEFQDFWITEKEMRMFVVMDVVFPALRKSTCFTKRYGHYVDGAGSVVQMTCNVEDVKAASKLKSHAVETKNRSAWTNAEMDIIRKLKLRYFTPQEVSNLMCFPPKFGFPAGLSSLQKYRALGNSLNVFVVSELIRLMVDGVV